MNLPQLKQIRLLPVVIAATGALLLLKGLGIMTTGGYVLTGPTVAIASGGGGGHGAPAAEAAGGDAGITLPEQPTMTDLSPVLSDGAPTLPLRGDTHGGGDAQGGGDAHGDTEVAEGHGEEPADAHETEVPDTGHGEAAVPEGGCPPVENRPLVETDVPEHGDTLEGFDFIKEREDCAVDPGVNEAGDALPTTMDGAGNIVPLTQVEQQTNSEDALLERLADRRTELDTREAELDMRFALVEAAEKRIEERTAVLEALEAKINAMVDEKRTLEESQFVAVIAMYETMKPKDAAAIFDQLEMEVLLRVARGINPRKMAPIMAKMDPTKAKELTAGLAIDQVEPTIELTSEDLSALPQIVGQ